jgi:hypothetical protein
MPPKFTPGDKVQKSGGSYQGTGTIKAVWLADDGTPRYVFRFDVPAGMCHIFNETQLAPYDDNALCGTCNELMRQVSPGDFVCVRCGASQGEPVT